MALDHSWTNMRTKAGENIASIYSSSSNLNDVGGYDAAGAWFEEEAAMNDNLLQSYVFGTGDMTNGHFTAEVWHDVTRVGCSQILIPKQTGSSWNVGITLCQYAGEPGKESTTSPNFTGKTVYKIEAGATTFQSSWACDNSNTPGFSQRGYDARYPHLCGNSAYTIEKL